MSYSRNVNLFWELLQLSDATLVVDNDMCYIEYGEEESESFDFGPKDLVFIFAEKYDIQAENA